MKKRIKIFIAAVLLFATLFGILASATPVSENDLEDLGYTVHNGTAVEMEEGVLFTVTGTSASIYCPIEKSNIAEDANTVFFVLSNASACEKVSVMLDYANGESSFSELVIDKNAPRTTYTLAADRCEELVGVSLNFGNIKTGTVKIYSIGGTAFFEESVDGIGEITECSYSSDTVTIKGSLQHSSDKKYHDATISVYALAAGDKVEDITSGKLSPIYEGGAMSIRFEFSLPINSVSDRFKRYAVAVVGTDGPVLVDKPVYPALEVPSVTHGFKGIETSATLGATDVISGLTVIDVEITDLMSKGNNGYMFTADSVRYFFDINYLKELDINVKTACGTQSEVYFRLLGFEEFYSSHGQTGIYAVSRFLCDRYSSSEHGKVSGIVLGENRNEKIPTGTSLADFAKESYDLLYTVFVAANDAKNPVNAVFSVSDRWGTAVSENSVSTDLFAEAIFSVCGYFSESRFGIMLEMQSNPYSLNNSYIEALGGDDREESEGRTLPAELKKADSESTYINAENIGRFLKRLSKRAKENLGAEPDIICAWSPNENTTGIALTASYVYYYYGVYSSDIASAFTVCLPSEAEREQAVLGDLTYVMKKINVKDAGAADFAKEIFKISDWKTEFSGFDQAKIESFVLKDSLEIKTEIPADIIGKYDYWDFATHSVGGWYAGAGCSSLSVENTKTEGRSLTARFASDKASSGEYAFFAYDYEDAESFKYNDCLLLDILISADSGRNFELNITLGGKGYQYEYKTTELMAGRRYTVALPLDEYTAKTPVEYIRIGTKELTLSSDAYSVSVYSLSAASKTYGDAELEKLIEKERKIKSEEEAKQEAPEIFWVIIIVLVLVVTAVVMVMIGKNKKNTRPEDRV